jgi:hypothetical protein
MTKNELSQLYYLNREIEEQQRRLMELECVATSCTSEITGMPHINGISDKVGKCVTEIADLKSHIELKLKKCFYELNRLNQYIESIEDSQMRMILSLRYINSLCWQQVAFSIGGGNTDISVQMQVNRFLKKK